MADYLSRIVDYDDWFVNPWVFKQVEAFWGPHSIDRFADHNTHLSRFNSRFACPGAEAVDAFTVDWGSENNWLCSPPMLIPRVIRRAEACKASGSLVVPCRESAPIGHCLPLRGGFCPICSWLLPIAYGGNYVLSGQVRGCVVQCLLCDCSSCKPGNYGIEGHSCVSVSE